MPRLRMQYLPGDISMGVINVCSASLRGGPPDDQRGRQPRRYALIFGPVRLQHNLFWGLPFSWLMTDASPSGEPAPGYPRH